MLGEDLLRRVRVVDHESARSETLTPIREEPPVSINTLYLEADLGGLLQEIRMDDIEREFTRDSFPHQLLASLASGENADPEALQLAWELVKEAQSS